ncbi:MAG: hypothetical protein ACRES6_04825 [Steroidobacteraceae bacterium]
MLPTVTIESTRLITAFDMALLLSALVAIAGIAWLTTIHWRQHRHR